MKKTMLIALCLCLIMACLTACNSEVASQCEHDYTSSVTKEPTYDADGVKTYVCAKCNVTYTEPIKKLEKHVISTSELNNALSKLKYSSGIFTISIGELVNSAVDNYKIEYLIGEEIIEKGYLSESDINDSVNIDNLYYAIVSGDCMINPGVPYMTNYETEAVKAWMVFDENDQLLNSGVTLCSNLQTCAMLIMSSSY